MTTPPLPHKQRRPLHVACGVVTLLLVTSACSPVYDGITGITRDEEGRLIGLWLGCNERPVGATLIQNSNTSSSIRVGEWVATEPSREASFSLQSAPAPDGWTIWQPGLAAVVPGNEYTLIAWKELNATNAVPVVFTADDLDLVDAGSVLIESTEGRERTTIVSRDAFDRMACHPN